MRFIPRLTPTRATLLVVALLTGCAAPLGNSTFQDKFVTHIYDNGIKLFRYEFVRSDNIRPILPFDQRGGFTDGKQVYTAEELRRKNARFLQEKAKQRLQQTNYCRDGFFTLDTLVSYGSASLRGECREAASAEDIERFPNTEREPGTAQPHSHSQPQPQPQPQPDHRSPEPDSP